MSLFNFRVEESYREGGSPGSEREDREDDTGEDKMRKLKGLTWCRDPEPSRKKTYGYLRERRRGRTNWTF